MTLYDCNLLPIFIMKWNNWIIIVSKVLSFAFL